ncbi:MAG: hypothetical protein OXU69_15705 [Gemmatimonadota bacterium]|nr:hypothetical protein [Gemmatimonadota bacterium]MDE2986147.1 hypothetical protein [Gemmatimonadota bacterium]
MTSAEGSTANTPQLLRTVAWIAVICVVPLGIVSCGQPDTPALPDGETTETADPVPNYAAQANDADDSDEETRTSRFNQLRRDLRAKVAAGEITEEQARQRISRMRQRMEAAQGEGRGSDGGR